MAATARMTAQFTCELAKIWNIVTSLDNYTWRSDLERIDVLEPGKKFVEYTKDGFATTFTITVFEPMRRYEFDMENENMSGHWVGEFEQTPDGTKIVFTENVAAKKVIMKPFVGIYLKNQQKKYLEDLNRAVASV